MTENSPTDIDSPPGDRGVAGVVVLGMHRSGTSATNGCFRSAGFHVTSDDDMMEADRTQPGGYNESVAVMHVNDEILGEFGRTWYDPPSEEELATVFDSGRQLARGVLDELLAGAGEAPLALKDPRINVLLPVWDPLLDGLLHPVLVIRDPIEIASSLAARERLARPGGLAAWELCTVAAFRYLNGKPVSIVQYSELMSNPQIAIDMVASVAKLLRPEYAAKVDPSKAAELLNPGLQRNRATGEEHYYGMTRYQQDLWDFLDTLPSGLQTLSVPDELMVAHPVTRQATKVKTEQLAMTAQLEQANAQLAQMAQVLRQAHDTLQATQAQAAQNQMFVNQTREDLQRALGDAAEMMEQVEQLAAERDAERARADTAEAESRRLAAELDAARQAGG